MSGDTACADHEIAKRVRNLATQTKEWARLEALHGAKTGEQILGDLCKWMDANGALATLRHGFKCYDRRLHVAFFKAAQAGTL